jgi:cytochrome c5
MGVGLDSAPPSAIIAAGFRAWSTVLRQHDQQFFDTFMLVIGILAGVAVGLFFLVRAISIDTQGLYIVDDPTVQAAIDERIRPVGRVLLMGDADLAAAAAAAVAAPKPVATVMTGPQVYNAACIVCHQPPGTGGAPPIGDVAVWQPRIAQGMDTLYMHALQGYQGEKGFMPPKGGRVDLSDDEIRGAVDYILEQSR